MLRATGPRALLRGARSLAAPGERGWRGGSDAGRDWLVAGAGRGGVAAAGSQFYSKDSESLDRLAVYCTSAETEPSAAQALAPLQDAEQAGYEPLLVEHREARGQRWDSADARIEGDEALARAVRFALFHLMGSVPDSGEAAVGARGLSGKAYRGHVFWDACVFVLPFLAATRPAAARVRLEYRIRRLPAALAAARAMGRRGARFPWESAADGLDVTPSAAFSRRSAVARGACA